MVGCVGLAHEHVEARAGQPITGQSRVQCQIVAPREDLRQVNVLKAARAREVLVAPRRMYENCRFKPRQAFHDAAPNSAEPHNTYRLSVKIGAERYRPRPLTHGLLTLTEPTPECEHQSDGLVGDCSVVSTRGDGCHAPEIPNRSHIHAIESHSSSGYHLKFRKLFQ